MNRKIINYTALAFLALSVFLCGKVCIFQFKLKSSIKTHASHNYTAGQKALEAAGNLEASLPAHIPIKKAGTAFTPATGSPQPDPHTLFELISISNNGSQEFQAIIKNAGINTRVVKGDSLGSLKVINITGEKVFMANDSMIFFMDTSGAKMKKKRI